MQSPTASLCATDAYSCLAITVLMAYRQALWGQLLAPSFVHWVALPRMCSSAPPRCPIRLQGIRPLPLRLPEAVKHPTQRRALAPPQMAWHQEAHGACCSRAAWSGPRCSRLKHVATGLARRRRLLVAVPLAPRGARPTRQAAQAMQQAAGGGLRHLPTAPGYAAAPLPAALPGGLEPAPPTEAAATPPAASAGSPPLPSGSISAFNTSVQARRDPIRAPSRGSRDHIAHEMLSGAPKRLVQSNARERERKLDHIRGWGDAGWGDEGIGVTADGGRQLVPLQLAASWQPPGGGGGGITLAAFGAASPVALLQSQLMWHGSCPASLPSRHPPARLWTLSPSALGVLAGQRPSQIDGEYSRARRLGGGRRRPCRHPAGGGGAAGQPRPAAQRGAAGHK